MSRHNLVIQQGKDFSETFTLTLNGSLVDLTSHTATMIFKNADNTGDLYFILTESSGLTLGGAAGTIVATILATDTTDIDLETYTEGVWQLDVVDDSSVVVHRDSGSFIVEAQLIVPA